MKRITRRLLSLLMAIAMIGIMTACGASGNDGNTAAADGIAADGAASDGESAGPVTAAEGEKIINIGVTDSLGGVNPFAIDQTEPD